MKIWRRGLLTENPYTRTAFRIANVPPEETQRGRLRRLIRQTERIVRRDPQAHTIAGEVVTDAELNRAKQILLDPQQRILEELLHHATERPPLQDIWQLNREVANLIASSKDEELPLTELGGLQPWIQTMVDQFLDAVPAPDPAFGPQELEVAPPFGRPNED